MNCADYRDALSARVDGELAMSEAEALERHLKLCAACCCWAEAVEALARWSNIAAREPAPDLSQSILSALDDRAHRRRVAGRPARAATPATLGARRTAWLESPTGVSRLGLVLVGLIQLCYAVPGLLLGDDAGAPVHIAREQGSWGAALAVALLVAAWRPHHVEGLLPFVGALAIGLAATAVIDIAAGDTSSVREVSHAAAIIALGLLWSLRATTSRSYIGSWSRRVAPTSSA